MNNFEIFPWDSKFNTGIAVIDEQHQTLVNLLNELAIHLANLSAPFILNQIYEKLNSYADYHFKTEENIWKTHFQNDEWFDNHEKSHESFLAEISRYQSEGKNIPLDDSIQQIVAFLVHWLASHILESDKRMAMVVMALESGLSLEEAKISANIQMSGSTKILIDTVLKMYDSLSSRTMELMREKSLRMQAEQALFASEEKWKFILESGKENIWDWNIEAKDNLKSEPEVLFFDILSNIRGDSNDYQIHPADLPQLKNDFHDHLEGKTEFYINKHRVLRNNGTWSWFVTKGKIISRDHNGIPLRMIGTNSNITERELATMIYLHSSQAMFITDASNCIISINPAFTKITGYTVNDILGKNPRILSAGKHDKQFYAEMWEHLSKNGSWVGEVINRKKNGEIYTESLGINTIIDAKGNVDHYIALFFDITDKKHNEILLRHSQKMSAIGQLTGGISHDFNNILSIIQTNIELLERNITDKEKIIKRVYDIKTAVKRAADLNVKLLNFSRQKPLNKSKCNINQLLKQMENMIVHSLTPQIKIKYILDETINLVEIDSGDFENSILNMLINARDAISGQGNIIIQTGKSNFNDVNCLITQNVCNGSFVYVSIQDDGTGISLNLQEHLFEPFYTTKEIGKGTGLGLATVYSFVKRSGGCITLDSKPGSGTTFCIYLPEIKSQEVQDFEMVLNEEEKSEGTEAILVVDDETFLLEALKEYFESTGYRVFTAENAHNALEILKTKPDINLLFSDIVMPEMNGYELAKQVSALYPKIKILLTSGYTRNLEENDKNDYKEFKLITKPYKLPELAKSIRDLLDSP